MQPDQDVPWRSTPQNQFATKGAAARQRLSHPPASAVFPICRLEKEGARRRRRSARGQQPASDQYRRQSLSPLQSSRHKTTARKEQGCTVSAPKRDKSFLKPWPTRRFAQPRSQGRCCHRERRGIVPPWQAGKARQSAGGQIKGALRVSRKKARLVSLS